jgi:hypothetical protein
MHLLFTHFNIPEFGAKNLAASLRAAGNPTQFLMAALQ